ncbi:YheC/D-like protein [Planifilum fimeticola]|uniref:YheC/D-like protein n=1 Tax=Planifilum fimeticola TaxID=201975 RepID=A0A2T0LEK7_9BACL|nr:YheC/D-like protein [Planifilum fimeticola]
MSLLENHSVGILLGSPVVHKIISGKPTYEKAELYFECGQRIGIVPILFDLKGLDLVKEQVSGFVWSPTNKRYLQSVQPIPPVIHKRILSPSPKLATLSRQLGRRLFNPPINRNKLRIHELLQQNARLQPHLPDTRKGSDGDPVPEMLRQYPAIFIKPVYGSLGHSILKIEATGDGRYLLQSHQGKKRILSKDQLKRILAKRFSSQRDYFLQQGIPLAKYRGSPFDLRVSVQKGEGGRWKISGVVAKVAPRRGILTNLAQNGKAVPAKTVLSHAFPGRNPEDLLEMINRLSLDICQTLEKAHPGFADAGLDIGIDQKGKPWFIEVNFRDLRYSFRSAGEYQMFQNTYLNPMCYAKFLISRRTVKSGRFERTHR